MAQGYDPTKAALYNKLIQEGLSESVALRQAGITTADFANYELNDQGQLGAIEIGFGKNPGVNNVTGTATGKAIENQFISAAGPVNFNDTGAVPAVSASSTKSTSSTTTTTNGGGSTVRVEDVGTPTAASQAYEAKANTTYTDIKAISRELGPVQFGGNPNLTQEERNALVEQRAALYKEYNQDTTASTNALAPSPPVGSATTPNTTTDVKTTETVTASVNAPVSGANDTQLQQQEISNDPSPTANSISTSPSSVDQTQANLTTTDVQAAVKANLDANPNTNTQPTETVSATDTKTSEDTVLNPDYNAGLAGTTQTVPASDVKYTPEQLDALAANAGVDAGEGGVVTDKFLLENENRAQAEANRAKATKANAKAQQTISQQRKQINSADWRVRLRLAPNSKYLYNANDPGILAPLSAKSGTDGVIFPYTPAIDTTYRAHYSPYDLTHSNYRGYFYGNSYTDVVNIRAMFTAQDTKEAEYLLAVIHFFRSVTKMFYGQDAQRGSPPPLVYLSGLGEYQFNEHSCLVSAFQYNLPSDVNYIRARSSNIVGGLNLTTQRGKQSVSTPGNFAGLNRLAAALLPVGGLKKPPSPPTLGLNNPTYVPTKIEISLSLLPVQSRQQVSNQFSVEKFASGNLLKGGFW